MTSVFDGITGVLNDVFGAPVQHTPAGGSARTIQAVLRREPFDIQDQDGNDLRVIGSTLKVRKADAVGIARGDQIQSVDGTFVVLASTPDGSPASDAFVIFDLEQETSNV